MRISDWSSDVCSSDLVDLPEPVGPVTNTMPRGISEMSLKIAGHFKSSSDSIFDGIVRNTAAAPREVLNALTRKRASPGISNEKSVSRNRSEEHTSELQSLMRISYAVFCLKKKNMNNHYHKVDLRHN